MKLPFKRPGTSTLFVLTLAVLVVSLVLAGCGGGGGGRTTTPVTTTKPPPVSTTTPPDSLAFPAGKYASTELYFDVFRIAYNVDDEGITIGIKARTAGYVALAIGNPHGKSDVIIGYVENGRVTLLDTHDASESGGHPLDSATGGKDDLTDISGSESNGVTTIEFRRLLNTGDRFDQPLIVGPNILVWAIGVNDSLSQEHSLVGLATFNVPLIEN